MSHIIKLLIRIYWLVPHRFRRHCLYKESCSNHVYRVSSEEGFYKGIKALKNRIKTCTPYYNLVDIKGQRILIHRNGSIIQNNQLADWLKSS